jgi:hypothetical protein
MAGARVWRFWRLMAVLAFAAVILATGAFSAAVADDFHIDNKIYPVPERAKDKTIKPMETTTLFASGRVYDFMKSPDETVVFDPAHDVVILLDATRHIKTQIATGDISTEIAKLREAAQNHTNEMVRDLTAAKFAESVDPQTGVLKLTSRWMQYEMETTAPARPQVAKQYADFADWQCQLNFLLERPPMPPFPRLSVNRVLRQRQELPVKITRTFTPEKKGWSGRPKEEIIRSEHTILMALSKEDQQRIDQAGEQMHKFQEMTFDEYLRTKNEAQANAEASLRR